MSSKTLTFLLTLLTLSLPLYSQNVSPGIASFFNDLMHDSADLSKYIDKTELAKTNRLGINYTGVKNKFLISYDIAPDLKEKIIQGIYPYVLNITTLDSGIQRVSFAVGKLNYSKDFYFRNEKLISPITYFTAGWKNFSSKYFNFYISNPKLFNNYSVTYLEKYIDGMSALLNFSAEEKNLLEKNKIIYVLCKDNDEIKKLTGFETRGIYFLAGDEIVTTYNCHLHELSHLLMNYKLKTLPLYTLSFFQEGFAVATGGRGGISRDILLDSGYYLDKSGFVPFNSIVTQNEFQSENTSVTYPVSGLYSFYLLHNYGLNFYLDTYRKYSGSDKYVKSIKIDSVKLPSVSQFETFIKNYRIRSEISLNSHEGARREIYSGQSGKIFKVDSLYQFFMKQNLMLSENPGLKDYQSKKFKELYPNLQYNGEKYLISTNKKEINIYNLYTNILIDSYSSGLSFDNKEVPVNDIYFTFFVNQKLFDQSPDNMIITSF